MSNAHGRQHALLQVDRRVRHPPAQAAGTETALLAAERHDLGVAAAPTHQVQAALLRQPLNPQHLYLAIRNLRNLR